MAVFKKFRIKKQSVGKRDINIKRTQSAPVASINRYLYDTSCHVDKKFRFFSYDNSNTFAFDCFLFGRVIARSRSLKILKGTKCAIYKLFIFHISAHILSYNEILRGRSIFIKPKSISNLSKSPVIKKRDFRKILGKHNNRKSNRKQETRKVEEGELFTFGWSRILSVYGIFHS